MKNRFLSGAAALAIAAGLSALSISSAHAGAAEFFKCKLAEGATMDQLVEATEAFVAAAEAAGHEGYSVRYLSPLFSGDISRGTFWWVGVGPNAAAIGAINDYWESEANKEHRERFGELSAGCSMSSLHIVTSVAGSE